MCNDDLGGVRNFFAECFPDQGIRLCIYCTGRVIQNQDLWFLKERPCDTQTLLLTTGYIVTSLDDFCIVTVRELLNESVSLRKLTYTFDFFIACSFITPADIFINGSREQYIFLKNHGYLVAQGFQAVITNINATDFDTSFCDIVKSWNELDKGRFCTSGSTDDTDSLSGFNMKINVFQR